MSYPKSAKVKAMAGSGTDEQLEYCPVQPKTSENQLKHWNGSLSQPSSISGTNQDDDSSDIERPPGQWKQPPNLGFEKEPQENSLMALKDYTDEELVDLESIIQHVTPVKKKSKEVYPVETKR